MHPSAAAGQGPCRPLPTILTGLIIGTVLGFILQRGRFCITGALRDLWVSRSCRWFTAFLLAIAVQAVGVAVLTSAGSLTPEIPTLSVVATVVGSFLFGVGIVLAGGCSIGNALVQTSLLSWQGWIALVFQMLGVGAAAWFLLIRPRQRRRAERAASRVPTTV